MKRTRFSEEQIVAILQEQESGMPTAEVCRRHGVGSATFYQWQARFGGLQVSDVRKLKMPEMENAKLKKLLAEQMLDCAMLKDVVAKKWQRPAPSAQPWLICAPRTRRASVGRARLPR